MAYTVDDSWNGVPFCSEPVFIRQTNAESVPTESEHSFEIFPVQILIQIYLIFLGMDA
jgi:hypothetical protein